MLRMFARRLPAAGNMLVSRSRIHSSSMLRAEMAFTFASPAEAFYDKADVKQVDVPSYNGYWGILPHHVPVLGVLKPGVVSVHEQSGDVKRYFVSSGSVTVNADSSVQVLAEEAVPVDRLDSSAVAEGIQKLMNQLTTITNDVERAEAQVALDCYEAMKRAIEGGH